MAETDENDKPVEKKFDTALQLLQNKLINYNTPSPKGKSKKLGRNQSVLLPKGAAARTQQIEEFDKEEFDIFTKALKKMR